MKLLPFLRYFVNKKISKSLKSSRINARKTYSTSHAKMNLVVSNREGRKEVY